jgi:hypothetical protein
VVYVCSKAALLSLLWLFTAAHEQYEARLAEWKQRQEALRKQRKEARKARAAASAHAADEERAASGSSDERLVTCLTALLSQRQHCECALRQQIAQF